MTSSDEKLASLGVATERLEALSLEKAKSPASVLEASPAAEVVEASAATSREEAKSVSLGVTVEMLEVLSLPGLAVDEASPISVVDSAAEEPAATSWEDDKSDSLGVTVLVAEELEPSAAAVETGAAELPSDAEVVSVASADTAELVDEVYAALFSTEEDVLASEDAVPEIVESLDGRVLIEESASAL